MNLTINKRDFMPVKALSWLLSYFMNSSLCCSTNLAEFELNSNLMEQRFSSGSNSCQVEHQSLLIILSVFRVRVKIITITHSEYYYLYVHQLLDFVFKVFGIQEIPQCRYNEHNHSLSVLYFI